MQITATPDNADATVGLVVDFEGETGSYSITRLDVLSGETVTIVSGTTDTNMLTDPGFESSTGPFGPVSGSGAIASSTEQHHSGAASLKVTKSGSGTRLAATVSDVSVQAGSQYSFSGWIYIASGVSMDATSAVEIAGSELAAALQIRPPSARDQWAELTGTVTATSAGSPNIYLHGSTVIGESVYFDDVRFGLVPESVATYTDALVPLGRNLIYTVTMDDGATASSAAVMVTPSLPIVSLQDGSQPVPVTVYDWPELVAETQTTIYNIRGRRSPVVSVGVEQMPSSTVTFVTVTDQDLEAFRQLVAAGDVLLVRATCQAVEDAYFVITKRTERRITKKGSDWRRFHVCEIQHVEPSGVFPSGALFPSDSLTPAASV